MAQKNRPTQEVVQPPINTGIVSPISASQKQVLEVSTTHYEPKAKPVDNTERDWRLGVGVAHGIGETLIGIFAGAEASKSLGGAVGNLESMGLDSAFPKSAAS